MARNDDTRATGFSVGARLKSFVYAARGVRAVLSQHNAWIHAVATVVVVVGGVSFGLERYEWIAIVAAIAAVWTAEALNTAFERLCDVASPDFHPLVEQAKDIAAGAVLIAAVGAATIGVVVFLPHFMGTMR
jgi:diacylglycerol kinase (ATP)